MGFLSSISSLIDVIFWSKRTIYSSFYFYSYTCYHVNNLLSHSRLWGVPSISRKKMQIIAPNIIYMFDYHLNSNIKHIIIICIWFTVSTSIGELWVWVLRHETHANDYMYKNYW